MQVKEKVNASNLMMIGMQTGNDQNISKSGKDTDTLSFANIFTQSKADANKNAFMKEKGQDVTKMNNSAMQKDSSVKSEKTTTDGLQSEKTVTDGADKRQTVTEDAGMERYQQHWKR